MKRTIIGFAVLVFAFVVVARVFAAVTTNLTSQVVVSNSAPTVSSVSITSSTITLNPNATTSVTVTAVVADNNGCTDLNAGTTTILLYRIGFTSSTCATNGGADSAHCYVASAFTASSTCTGSSTSINTTTTFALQYFARATDSSSSYPATGWKATVIFKDPSNATSSNESTASTLSTLVAINVTTSSINYDTIAAGTNTTSTNEVATTSNAGNASTTLQLSAISTLTSGANSIATSSQVYSTSTFTYPGTSTQLTGTAVTVGGFVLTAPTATTTVVSKATYWGLAVPAGTAIGTYTGTNLFSSLFTP